MAKKGGQKIWAWVDPPPSFGQCPKRNVFFLLMSSLRNVVLVVAKTIGEEGWMILARELTQRPGVKANIAVTRAELGLGQRQDIKKIFDAQCFFRIYETQENLCAYSREASVFISASNNSWKGMERVLDNGHLRGGVQ